MHKWIRPLNSVMRPTKNAILQNQVHIFISSVLKQRRSRQFVRRKGNAQSKFAVLTNANPASIVSFGRRGYAIPMAIQKRSCANNAIRRPPQGMEGCAGLASKAVLIKKEKVCVLCVGLANLGRLEADVHFVLIDRVITRTMPT